MKKKLWLIWKKYKIGVLAYDGLEYSFKYENPELSDAIKDGFICFAGFPDLVKEYKSDRLFANIETRLPNPKRPDYLAILNSYDLDLNVTKWDILEATRGRLVTDNYEFVPVFDKRKIEFDVAGTRYNLDKLNCKKMIDVNTKLSLEIDDSNEYDKNAVKVIFDNGKSSYHLGFVPRYYAKYLYQMLKEKIDYSAMVKSISFDSASKDEDICVSVKLIFK